MRTTVSTLVMLGCLVVAAAGAPAEKPRALVVTGGHGFDEQKFGQTFKRCTDMEVNFIAHKKFLSMLKDGSAAEADVFVMFNHGTKIDKKARKAFKKALKNGTGLVVLHHAIIGYPGWPGYCNITGGRYFHNKRDWKGQTYEPSSFKHDVDMPVNVTDTDHPITRGIGDFKIHDETYAGMWVDPDNTVLLTTDHPKADRELGWAKTWKKARVVYIQPGHGPTVYGREPYQKLVARSMRWTARMKPAAE